MIFDDYVGYWLVILKCVFGFGCFDKVDRVVNDGGRVWVGWVFEYV